MLNKSDYETVLGDDEVLALQMFIDNPLQATALKKVLLFKLRSVGVTVPNIAPFSLKDNGAFSFVANMPQATDEEVGKQLKVLWECYRLVENVWDDLVGFSMPKERSGDKGENPAR